MLGLLGWAIYERCGINTWYRMVSLCPHKPSLTQGAPRTLSLYKQTLPFVVCIIHGAGVAVPFRLWSVHWHDDNKMLYDL